MCARSAPAAARRVRLLSVRPETMYAKSGGHFLAYQLVGEGDRDLVAITEMVSHCEHRWEEPRLARSLQRLASFGRLILFDRRGTGLSDPVPVDRLPTLEERADDLAAVIDATGAERPVLVGFSEGGLDACSSRRRAQTVSRRWFCMEPFRGSSPADDYPFGYDRHLYKEFVDGVVEAWGTGRLLEAISPSMVGDERLRTWWAGYERLAASPGVAEALLRLAFDVDVREVVPLMSSPTLVLHRRDDVFSSIGHARYLADHIPGAELVALPGNDHPLPRRC